MIENHEITFLRRLESEYTLKQLFDIEQTYTKSEHKIMDYILQNQAQICLMSITELSSCLHISESTISRFCKHAGFEDFKDLKRGLGELLTKESPATKMAATLATKEDDLVTSMFCKQQLYLDKTRQSIEQKVLENAAFMISKARTIYIHGKGASYSLAVLLQFRLNRFFPQVVLLPCGSSELFEALQHISNQDLVITFGFQSVPVEGKVLLDYRHTKHYKTILFTSKLYDEASARADLNLFAYRGEPEEFHSMASAVVLIDTLTLVLASLTEIESVQKLSNLHKLKEHYQNQIPK